MVSAASKAATLLLHCMIFAAMAAAATPKPLSFARSEIPAGPDCCSVVSGDFNGDGKLDLAVTFSDPNAPQKLLVLMGHGDGTFTAKSVVDLTNSMVLVAAVDVNGDKKPDLLAIDAYGGSSFLLLGNGEGTFQPPKMIASAQLLRVADFNGDGKPDLLLRNLDVQLGNGDGTFGNIISTPAAHSSTALAFLTPMVVADFNGDGKLDVAFNSTWHSGRGVVFVWLGNGDGTFTPQPENRLLEGNFDGTAAAVLTGDFDGDGKLDLLLGGGPSGFFGVLLGNGDGTFRTGTTGSLHGATLVAGDFNGDGKLDLASESSVAFGNGDGTFQPAISFGYGPVAYTSGVFVTPQYPPIIAADFNRDGKLDLVAPSRITGTFSEGLFVSSGVSILLNDSPGPANSVTGVSAPNGGRVLALGSIASIYGSNLSQATASAPGLNFPPTKLGGISLHLRDALGTDHLAPLFYVSPSQVNFLVPSLAAEGLATLNIDDGSDHFVEGQRTTMIQMLAPAFFTADGTGKGAAAATAVRVFGSAQIPVPVFTCSGDRCSTVPIDLSQGAVYLSLYGTGFRATAAGLGVSSLVQCQIHDQFVSATYAGPQNRIAGLDQLNLRLPPLANVGETDVVCSFSVAFGSERADSLPVKINIK